MSAFTKTTSMEQLATAVAAERGARMCVLAPASAHTDGVLLRAAHTLRGRGRNVIVACASETGAQRLRAVAARAGRPATAKAAASEPDALRITTVRDLALEALADARVQAQVKRTARVLDANEMDILMEDVKVSGLKVRRLSEMLKFFYHSIADGSAEREGWMVSPEETMVYAILEENLEARRACLPCEPAAKAWQGLTAADVEPADQVVIAEDYGAMSATSQRLLRYLSGGELIAFGSDRKFETDFEPYPNPEGMRDYAEEEGVAAFELVTPAAEETETVSAGTPLQEFSLVAEQVRKAVAAGIAPADILVAAPNGTWARYVGKELSERAIPTWVDLAPRKRKGDPRDPQGCGGIKLAAFAKLLRSPDDFTALRTFMGAGDWLCRSDGFLELLAFARDHEVEVPVALQMMREPENAQNATNSFRKLLGPLAEYDELREVWAHGTAGRIREAMAAHGMPLEDAGALLGADDAQPNVQAFLEGLVPEEPAFAEDAVVVAPYDRCHGHRAKTMIVSGMVDGFMPKRDAVDDAFTIDHRNSAIERDRMVLEGIKASASEQVIFTNFDHDVLENTAALHMVTTRVYHSNGRRMARVAPSTLLAR